MSEQNAVHLASPDTYIKCAIQMSVRRSVRLSVCGQNRVCSVSSTILIASISYLHILSSNFRRYGGYPQKAGVLVVLVYSLVLVNRLCWLYGWIVFRLLKLLSFVWLPYYCSMFFSMLGLSKMVLDSLCKLIQDLLLQGFGGGLLWQSCIGNDSPIQSINLIDWLGIV